MANEEESLITSLPDFAQYLKQLPLKGVVCQEKNGFTCIQLGPKWQAKRKSILETCQTLLQYNKKVAEGKHKLGAKLGEKGVATEPDNIGFHFFPPLSPSGYHISLKVTDPKRVKPIIGTEVSFKLEKVIVFGCL